MTGDPCAVLAELVDVTKALCSGRPVRNADEVIARAEALVAARHADLASCGMCKQQPGVTIYINDDCPEHGDHFELYEDDILYDDVTEETHGMLPGSHERAGGPECRCGAPWSRWNDACTAGTGKATD